MHKRAPDCRLDTKIFKILASGHSNFDHFVKTSYSYRWIVNYQGFKLFGYVLLRTVLGTRSQM